MKSRIISIGLSLLTAGAMTASHAQDDPKFPERPITIVVPYLAGGASDFHARTIAQPLSKVLGQQVIVDNKPGASGAVGSIHVANARPDGYTLLYANNGQLIAPLLNPSIGYHPIEDFAPVTIATTMPMVLVVPKSLPVDDMAGLIRYAKDRPGQLNYATAGIGSYGNLATILLSQMGGIEMTQIPYKGEAGTTMAIRTNESQVLMTSPSKTMLGLAADGTIKILGVASATPSELVPGVRTIGETIPGFTAEIWFGLLAPAGTSSSTVRKINAAVSTVLADPDVRTRLLSSGAAASPSTPEAFGQAMKAEHARWAEIIKEKGIK